VKGTRALSAPVAPPDQDLSSLAGRKGDQARSDGVRLAGEDSVPARIDHLSADCLAQDAGR
jgi:hypothetical protein